MIDISKAQIENPKRAPENGKTHRVELFPYYPGYSASFTEELLASLELKRNSVILDPWNGCGTTTKVAASMGYAAIGCDLNPVMVLIANANQVSPLEARAIVPLAQQICKKMVSGEPLDTDFNDPLLYWLAPSSVKAIRRIEAQINRLLINSDSYMRISSLESMSLISPIAAVMYVGLFRMCRSLLHTFYGSNPTWVKKPREAANRRRPSEQQINAAYQIEIAFLSNAIANWQQASFKEVQVPLLFKANSTALPIIDESVDLVLTSPPYCTRIDYAVATSVELALLRVSSDEFSELRRAMLGTSTVPKQSEDGLSLGSSCETFLDSLKRHSSVASAGYYFKNHLQYFQGIHRSIAEISRTVRRGGSMVTIVQDSYYKNIHNDLPKIFSEMAEAVGMALQRRVDFATSRSMVTINSKARLHKQQRTTIESVLCFRKN